MSEEKLLETPLAAEHVRLGAKMVPFAGWNMPVQYTEGILAEHHHTRQSVSLFDICHMGEFRLKGPGSAEKLDHALARSVADQPCGVCRYNFLLNERGGVIDDLIVYRIGETEFFIVVNAARRGIDFDTLKERLGAGLEFRDESDATAKLDLQGPKSAEVLARLGLPAAALPKYYHFMPVKLLGLDMLLSRTGYTGELGFELYFDAAEAVRIWRELLNDPEVKPAGLGARDTLRLEMGYPLYGHELNEETTPVEGGFGAMLKLDNSARDFVGGAALRQCQPAKKLIGLKLDGRRAARAGMTVLADGKAVGTVTSGAFAPSLNCAVAMAMVTSEAAEKTAFTIDLQRAEVTASRHDFPFYAEGTARKK